MTTTLAGILFGLFLLAILGAAHYRSKAHKGRPRAPVEQPDVCEGPGCTLSGCGCYDGNSDA
jgi:hypothetical protein